MTPLDTYDMIPPDMRAYLSHYGWHFSKAAYEFAVHHMTNEKGHIEPYTKEQIDSLLSQFSITIEHNIAYDAAFVASMCRADFFGSSIEDEHHLALYVKDTLDDPDAADGTTMRRWYASMVAAGIPVPWSDIL